MKLFFALVVVGIFSLVIPPAVSASTWYYNCTVDQVGPTATGSSVGARIYITCGSNFIQKKCDLPSDRYNEFMAVALTAIVAGKKVTICLDDPNAPVPNMTSLFMTDSSY